MKARLSALLLPLFVALVGLAGCDAETQAPLLRRNVRVLVDGIEITKRQIGTVVDVDKSLAQGGLRVPELGASVESEIEARMFVECALPDGTKIQAGEHSFVGRLGLAPQWEQGACDDECRQRVSACVLARAWRPAQLEATPADEGEEASEEVAEESEQGLHFQPTPAIELAVPLAALRASDSMQYDEGAYFGDLFEGEGERYACRGRGFEGAALASERCSGHEDCDQVRVVGNCEELCSEVDGNWSACLGPTGVVYSAVTVRTNGVGG